MHLPSSLASLILTLLTLTPTSGEYLPSNHASLLWGPYRSNLYMGIRPRVPQTLLMGLMWGKLDEQERQLRHTCEQSDGMAGYGWSAYDPRQGGTQTIQDMGNEVDITTEVVKIHEGELKGNWRLRVRGLPRENATTGLKTSVVFYVAMEAMAKCQECHLDSYVEERKSEEGEVIKAGRIRIDHPKLGASTIDIPVPKHGSIFAKSIQTTEDMLWQSKSLYLDLLNNTEIEPKLYIPNEAGSGNMHFVQIVFEDQFEFDVSYHQNSATRAMTSSDFTSGLDAILTSCLSKFSKVFSPNTPFNDDSYTSFGQALLANLLGGLSYFHGDTKVDRSYASEYHEPEPNFWEKVAEAQGLEEIETEGPYELFTHVPSRTAFPRGFLWDEGFHLLVVLDWDADLAIEVLRSWLNLMEDDGWIAREQILGPEARSKVPDAFQVQRPHIANPPTLFLVVAKLVDLLSRKVRYSGHPSVYIAQPKLGQHLLEEIYPLLKKHYGWFRKVQSADVEAHSVPQASLSEGYRWRGRTPGYNFASGLDDYPRAEPPHPTELHVDALSWVGVMADSLLKIARYIQIVEDVPTLETQCKGIVQNMGALHWSDKAETYCDARVFDGVHMHTCPKGYVSLFPFITGFLGPEHPHLNATLNVIRDPSELWTPHGIRSLSPSSTRYGTDDNYWRSPIWININYMVIERLLALATTPGPLQQRCREIYRELRQNVVNTVYKSWNETGYAWEQYNPETGHGQRTQGFTGWTALVVNIMAFPSLDEVQPDGVKEKIGKLFGDGQGGAGWGSRSVIVGGMLVVFVWVTRRRFASLLRGILRRQ